MAFFIDTYEFFADNRLRQSPTDQLKLIPLVPSGLSAFSCTPAELKELW